nr:Eco57I restriction-modification methylase domain-containing protein [uncultured Clostridium sp.]
MIIGIQDEILKIHSLGLLDRLLCDKTTNTNILWATDAYAALGSEYERDKEIQLSLITGGNSGIIKNRARKALEQQTERTRRHAEVFTPLWVCKQMNDHADEVWFGRSGVFFDEEGNSTENIVFPQSRRKIPEWQRYVDSRRLEITCGEAPYLVSRYDVSTGEYIEIRNRIGILDRKLRVVNENARDESEWLTWALRAFQSTYGYEFQGDNLLIARVNLLMTYEAYLHERWKRKPTAQEYREIIKTIVWNIWQMDGLSGTIPYCKTPEDYHQISLLEWMGSEDYQKKASQQPHCKIKSWRRKDSLEYLNLKEGGRNMKFDFVIGNPPYQEDTESDSTRMLPVYNSFMDECYIIADKVELITPARFLFNAGQTPKKWNEKMLNDEHLKVLYFEQNAASVFPNTDIKGGVAITYHDNSTTFKPIKVFVPWEELSSSLQKVGAKSMEESLSDIADSSNVYDLKNIYQDHPDYTKYIADNGRHAQLKTNVLNINPIFTDKPSELDDYKVHGLINGKRGFKYCHRRYIKSTHKSLFKYKVLVPKATGSGRFGDALPEIFVVEPEVCFTQTYISIGTFETEQEAKNLSKYLKTKTCRALLGVLKVTQDNLPATWACIPKQNFTNSSDIDWSKTIAGIDRQLYAKYDLDEAEIAFIESHVKEMA